MPSFWFFLTLPCEVEPVNFSASIPEWAKPGRCGTNAVYAFLRLSGQPIPYEEVAHAVPTEAARGSSLADLSEAANHFGVRTEVRKVSIQEMSRISTPFIVHLDLLDQGGAGHFITVYHIDDEKIVCYIDGSSALEHFITLSDLDHQFSGYVLLPASRSSVGILPALIGCALGAVLGLIRSLMKPTEKVHEAN